MRRMGLAEYLHQVCGSGEDAAELGLQAALDALRVVERPTLAELAASANVRRIWVEAAKQLEHERALRLALALRSPGLRLEDAREPTETELVEHAVSLGDEAVLRALGGAA